MPASWAVPPAIRTLEYGLLIWIADGDAAAFALLGVLAFHHYDLVYRLAQPGRAPPAWVGAVAGGWDGRLVLACVLLAAGALPAGLFVARGVLAVLFVGEAHRELGRFERAERQGRHTKTRRTRPHDRHGARRGRGQRGSAPTRTTCRRRCCRSTATARSSTSRSATSRASASRTSAIVTGFAAQRIEERAPRARGAPRRRARARLQPEGRGVEQRVLALVRTRALRRGRAAGQRRHGAPGVRRGAAARGARRGDDLSSRSTTRRTSARRR